MKKVLLQLVLVLLPFFALAQDDAPVTKDFTGKIKKIVTSFKLNDHVSVIQTNIDDDNFELIAVDDKMAELWRISLKGFAIGAGKFNGQVLAVAGAGFSDSKAIVSPYSAFLVDAQTGKLIQQKSIYSSTYDKKEWAKVFFDEAGSNVSLVIGETDNTKMIPILEIFNVDTKDITVINLNEKLEAVGAKHIVPGGNFVGIACNEKHDIFISTVQDDKTLKVSKYEAGKSEPSGFAVQNIDLKDRSDVKFGNPNGRPNREHNAWVVASSTDRNVVYFAVMHKERELTISKLNVGNNTGQTVNESINKTYIKSIEKDYTPVDKKFEKPNIESSDYMNVRYLGVHDGSLVVALSSLDIKGSSITGGYFEEDAVIIKGYDNDLKQKFQQLLPSSYEFTHPIHASFHFADNSLYVIANTGNGTKSTYFGNIDLGTGNWSALKKLTRKDIKNYEYAERNVLWFKSGFMIPYMAPHGMIIGKEVINLQLNTY